MSDETKITKKGKKDRYNWARRSIARANAERFENGNVPSFDALKTPYGQRKKRGKTADSTDDS